MSLSTVLKKGRAFLTPRGSTDSIPTRASGSFAKAPEGQLFPKVNPAQDGEDCDKDCGSCEIHYPKGFKIDEEDELYGHVNQWDTHMLVATGKTDWVKHVEDEKGSLMEAVRDCQIEPKNGKLMLSASNMPSPEDHASKPLPDRPTTVLLLPAFDFIDNVTPATVKDLIEHHISPSRTNTTPLKVDEASRSDSSPDEPSEVSALPSTSDIIPDFASLAISPSSLTVRPCPHRYLILLCSQRTRDARCGQSAPLLKREFERHLRPLGLYRDLHDARTGGVGIYFISHVGGHKYSANVMVYRRTEDLGEARQCIWLARVRPEDCEGIIRFTLLQGKVVKPERQLRGGFDRERGLASW